MSSNRITRMIKVASGKYNNDHEDNYPKLKLLLKNNSIWNCNVDKNHKEEINLNLKQL